MEEAEERKDDFFGDYSETVAQEVQQVQEMATESVVAEQVFPCVRATASEKSPEFNIPLLKVLSDQSSLGQEQQVDESLAAWRSCADNGEHSLFWDEDGLLKMLKSGQLGEELKVVVVPRAFRRNVLILAHDRHGHLGTKKVRALMDSRVTWPGIGADVTEWCESCAVCQKEKRSGVRKIPMQRVPVVVQPFEKVAIDLVGPFERSPQGFRVVLTMMDLATRWPEAIPLKKATAMEVAEALCDLFSRFGVPRQILSD